MTIPWRVKICTDKEGWLGSVWGKGEEKPMGFSGVRVVGKEDY